MGHPSRGHSPARGFMRVSVLEDMRALQSMGQHEALVIEDFHGRTRGDDDALIEDHDS